MLCGPPPPSQLPPGPLPSSASQQSQSPHLGGPPQPPPPGLFPPGHLQNGPPMTMGPYNPGGPMPPHMMHHPPHPMQHPGGGPPGPPPPPPNHMQGPPPGPPGGPHGPPMFRRHGLPPPPPPPFFEMRQPELRVFEMNRRLQQRADDTDNLWWDAFTNEFFEDDATLTITFCLEDGPKRYTIGRTLIPRYFRSIFEGGVTEMQLVLKFPKESFHNNTVTLDCDQATIHTQHGKPNFKMGPYPPNDPMKEQIIKENTVFVATDGRLVLEFMIDDLMRIKSWHFSTRHHQEMISRGLVAMQQAQQDLSMMENMTKNITRQGLTNSTLNYLRLCVILEPMQELMTRHKAYSLSPRDCLKTTLFQKWQRMVAPPETARPPSKRRKRKSSTGAGGGGAGSATGGSKKKNAQNNMSPVPPPFTLATQDVMVVGEPSLMGGEFGDEDERLITRLENNQFDPSLPPGANGLDDNDDFNSLGSNPMGLPPGPPPGMMMPGGPMGMPGGGPPPGQWCQPNGPQNSGNNTPQPGIPLGPPPPGMGPPQGGHNGPNSQEDIKKQSPGIN